MPAEKVHLIDFAEQARRAAEHGPSSEAIAAYEAELQREYEANAQAATDGGWPDVESYLDSLVSPVTS